MRIKSLGSGNWEVLDYTRKDGKPISETDYSSPVSLFDSTHYAGETGSAGQVVFIEPVTPFASATTEQFI